MSRPTFHPDEITGPWEAYIIYDHVNGFDYAQSLQVHAIDGVSVKSIEAIEINDSVDGEERTK